MAKPSLTIPLVANMLGVTYRQMDYLLRTGPLESDRIGRYRCLTPDQVHRLQVATVLNDVIGAATGGDGLNSALPRVVQTVMAGPEPSGNWVALHGDAVSYGATVASLFPKSKDSVGAIVSRMPELWP